jgi:hypothetical protein
VTQFWNTNDANRVISYDTLNSIDDKIILLQANINSDRTGLFTTTQDFNILGIETIDDGLPNAGLPDVHEVSILPTDVDLDGVPDNMSLSGIIHPIFEQQYQLYTEAGSPLVDTLQLNTGFDWIGGYEDIDVHVWQNGTKLVYGTSWSAPQTSTFKNQITITGVSPTDIIKVKLLDYVYFQRASAVDPWLPVTFSDEVRTMWVTQDTTASFELLKREEGKNVFNFAWFHFTDDTSLIDPSFTNIHDAFIITSGFYTGITQYINNQTDIIPTEPTPLELRTSYAKILEKKTMSDTVIMHSGSFKILFGTKANSELQASLKVIRGDSVTKTDNQIKVDIVDIVRSFFDLNQWEFGETFYFSELSAVIHSELGSEIDSVVLVPTYANSQFGDLYQISARENEVFVPDISTTDIEIVTAYTAENIRQ